MPSNIDAACRGLAARRTLDGSVQVRREAQESGEAAQQWLSLPQVAADLESGILGLGLVEETLSELNAAARAVFCYAVTLRPIPGTTACAAAAQRLTASSAVNRRTERVFAGPAFAALQHHRHIQSGYA